MVLPHSPKWHAVNSKCLQQTAHLVPSPLLGAPVTRRSRVNWPVASLCSGVRQCCPVWGCFLLPNLASEGKFCLLPKTAMMAYVSQEAISGVRKPIRIKDLWLKFLRGLECLISSRDWLQPVLIIRKSWEMETLCEHTQKENTAKPGMMHQPKVF